MPRCYWLMKSEPEVFGIGHLARCADRTSLWDGVRNYQARNLLRDQVQFGDRAFFYHSSCAVPAVVGIARVVRAGYPDPTQFRKSEKYYDANSPRGAPRWFAVDIQLETVLPREVSLAELRETPGLAQMVLLNRSRLSVQPVTAAEWKIIVQLSRDPAPAGRG